MRDYGKIRAAFWSDEKTAALSVNAKLLACYLLSCSHSNAIGCFRIPTGYVSEDLGWSPETVREGFRELFAIRFIYRSENDGWTLIRKFLQHNPIENPNVGRACMKMVDDVPVTFEHFDKLINSLEPYAERFPEGYLDGLRKRFAHGLPNREPEPEPEPEPILSVDEPPSDASDRFEEFWQAYPSRGDHPNPKKPARQKFATKVKAGSDPGAIIGGAARYAEACERNRTDPQYVAQAVTWLNQERWKDGAGDDEDLSDLTPEERKIYLEIRAKAPREPNALDTAKGAADA